MVAEAKGQIEFMYNSGQYDLGFPWKHSETIQNSEWYSDVDRI